MADEIDDTAADEVEEDASSTSDVAATAASTDSPKAPSDAKAKADAAVAARKVERRTVTSRRVTPKGGAKVEPSSAASKARDAKKTDKVVQRAEAAPAPTVYPKGPSPWWVPAIMFGLLIVGALIIMLNYMGAFGEASNVLLVAGLGFILGGIIAATQYR